MRVLVVAVLLLSTLAETLKAQRSLQAVPLTELPPPEKRWALLVGVDEYDDRGIGRLYGAANDARAIKSALTKYAGFNEDQVVVLGTGEPGERAPTRTNILARLSNLTKVVPKDGLLVVGFSGHGIERQSRAFLLASNSVFHDDARVLEQTAVGVDMIRTWIRDAGIQQVILFIDACRNEPGGRADAPNRLTQSFADAFKFELRNTGIVAFATLYATRVGERAYEYTEKKRGYFSWALEQAIAGKAANDRGEVTLSSIIRYLEEQVPKLTALELGSSKVQTPRVEVGGYRASDLVVSVTKESVRCSDAAKEAWALARESQNRAVVEDFVLNFPSCDYAKVARLRLMVWEDSRRRVTPPPSPAQAQAPKGPPRFVQPGGAEHAIFHPNGRWAIVSDTGGTVAAWNLATGKILRRFEGSCGSATAANVLFGGDCALVSSRDGAKILALAGRWILIWDFDSGKRERLLEGPPGSKYFNAVFSRDDKMLFVSSSASSFDVWDLAEGKLLRTIPGHSFRVDLSPDGKSLLSGGVNGPALWNLPDFKKTWTSSQESIPDLRFSPSGKMAAFGSEKGRVEVRNMELGTSRYIESPLRGWVRLEFSEDEKQLMVSGSRDGGKETIFYDLDSTKEVRKAGFAPWSWSPDRRHALAWHRGGVSLLDGRTGEELRTVECCRSLIDKIQFVGPTTVVASSRSRQVTEWNWATGDFRAIASDLAHFSIAGEGDLALAGGGRAAAQLHLFRRVSAKWQKVADLGDAGRGTVRMLDVSPDGKWALSGATLWDLTQRKEARRYESIDDARFSPDGRYLLGDVSHPHHEVRIVHRDTGEIHRTMRGHTSYIEVVASASNSEFVVSGSRDKTVRIWDVKTGLEKLSLRGHNDWITAVAVSPDSRLVLSGADDSTVRVWDAGTGRQLHVLQHETPIAAIVFTPDGKYVATGSWDGVRIWDPRTGNEVTGPPPAR